MIDVLRQFRERVTEVDTYYAYLETLLVDDAHLVLKDGVIVNITTELSQILRANAFLLLYNVVESSISQAIEEIHSDILRCNTNYDDLRISVKMEFVKHIKKEVASEKFTKEVENLLTDVLKFYPKSSKVFSGNVDAKKIREMGVRYGFSVETDRTKTRDGFSLLTVKDKRNNLAHGYISFQECGRDFTIQDMLKIKREVISYVSEILDNINSYISRKEYFA